MIFILPFLLAITPPIDSSIASQNASYNGSTFELEGDVSLKHEFGEMKAGKASLSRQLEGQEGFPFASIELESGVHLNLATEAAVDCEKAHLDFSTLQGTLSQDVHYVDLLRSSPFELFTPHLDLQMAKEPVYSIETATATQGVHLIYDTLYHLKTESIHLSKELIQGPHPCTWSQDSSTVRAANFTLDLSQNRLHLQTATGNLNSFSKGTISFTADALDWKHAENYLLLQGSPRIEESGLGVMTSDKEITLLVHNHAVHRLTTQGKTTLTSHKGHLLTTDGPIDIDQETHLATISSPLIYKEDEMVLEALAAEVHYNEEGFHPSGIDLQGEVKISSPNMYGIADSLSYNPETRSCVLKAQEGQRVLFARHQDNFSMSAPEVHITYDPITKEQKVQGIGHVAFSLSLEEQKLLTQVFQHGASTP